MSTMTDREDAAKQIHELVNSGYTDILLDFLKPSQVKQLAEDWRENGGPNETR